jgi:hypothetical protein
MVHSARSEEFNKVCSPSVLGQTLDRADYNLALTYQFILPPDCIHPQTADRRRD